MIPLTAEKASSQANTATSHSAQGTLVPVAPRGSAQLLPAPRRDQAPALSTMPDALSLLKALYRRLALALTLGLLAGGIAGAATWFAVPASNYSAQALLNVASLQPKIIFNTSENRTDFNIYQRTQLTWIKSHLVLNAALKWEINHWDNSESDKPEKEKVYVSSLDVVKRQVDPIAWLE